MHRIIPGLLFVIASTLLVLSFFIEGQKVTDFSSAAFLPAVTAFLMLVCSLFIMKRGVAAPSPHSVPEPGEQEDEEESLVEIEDITKKQLYVRLISFTVVTIIFAYLMNFLNFLIISFVFLFGAMILLNRKKIVTALIVSIIMSGVFYYLFSSVFKIVFPT
ncbi:tripartite tricarboxylate transporter TctB family protein [Bacillus sp. OxB-1]|uniref:tripartite tricarboxylate transporter TctB family protein n=1 Tax=Bacillus sp. (strain OxB-1) TaxID=98228 RepID=UPI00130D9E62|nr:tripartite tricarboxylate transporter TctB family protein [Bacillus sp. OxB-1]